MDSAYDVGEIRTIADLRPRPDHRGQPWGKAERKRTGLEAERRRHAGYQTAEKIRYGERTAAERVNARLRTTSAAARFASAATTR
ncbi:MAG: hypothetical protein H6907_15350 [Hyphomicrobiales bacterium]|nr:hypothetical protein [Hyphomicrobiales bacterium]